MQMSISYNKTRCPFKEFMGMSSEDWIFIPLPQMHHISISLSALCLEDIHEMSPHFVLRRASQESRTAMPASWFGSLFCTCCLCRTVANVSLSCWLDPPEPCHHPPRPRKHVEVFQRHCKEKSPVTVEKSQDRSSITWGKTAIRTVRNIFPE